MRRAKFMVSFGVLRKALNLPDNCEIIAVKDPEPQVFMENHVYVYVEGEDLPKIQQGYECEEIAPGFTRETVLNSSSLRFYKWNVWDTEPKDPALATLTKHD